MRCFLVVFVTALLAVSASPLAAQCADGTPPPCEVRAARMAANVVVPPAAEERTRRFLVLPFRNVSRSAEAEWLVEGSPTLLADALGQWQDVYVVPPERLYPALRRHGLEPGAVMAEDAVRKVAAETGGWTAVSGDIIATGNRMQISARVYDVADGKVVLRARQDVAQDADVREAYDGLAAQLLEVAGLDVEGPRLAGVTTQSIEAYKAYQRGMAHYNRSELKRARDEFTRAIELDSTFAQAYMKLAEASMTNIESFTNPQSDAYRYAERALALSARLPTRDREFVQSLSDLFRGQISSARERLERLLAADSNDVQVLENLADLDILDPILVERGGRLVPRQNLNNGARLAKRALALDPATHSMYMNLAMIYARAGGDDFGRVAGIRAEQPSLLALLQKIAQPDTTFVVLLRDSLELFSLDSLAALPEDTVEAARTRARDIAVAWTERWLAASGDEGIAHLNASDVFTLAEEYDRALTHLARAESLGVEIEFFTNFGGRRAQILIRAGRYDDAVSEVDSLKRAGYFHGPAYAQNNFAQVDAAWAFNVYVLRGRFAAAESLVTELLTPLTRMAHMDSARALGGILSVFALRAGPALPPVFPEIPDSVREAMIDTLLTYGPELPPNSLLRGEIGRLMRLSYYEAEEHAIRQATRFRRRAAQLLSAGESDLALQVLIGADDMDSTATAHHAVFDLYEQLVGRDSSQVIAYYRMGRLAATAGIRLQEGLAALEAFLARPAPDAELTHADGHYRIGQIHEKLNQPDRARASYEQALALEPNHAQATRALERLNTPGDR